MGDHIHHHHHHHVELSDDIILEIFLQLPVKYIFQYRSLSKTSNRLLFDPSFYAQYQRRRRLNRESQQLQLLGFFQGCKSWYWTTIEQEGAPKLSFLPVCKQGMPLTSRPFLKKDWFHLGFLQWFDPLRPPSRDILCVQSHKSCYWFPLSSRISWWFESKVGVVLTTTLCTAESQSIPIHCKLARGSNPF